MYSPYESVEAFVKQVMETPFDREKVLLLFVTENLVLEIPSLMARLNKEKLTFFGGIFPEIIAGDRHYTRGISYCWMDAHPPVVVENISLKKYTLQTLQQSASKAFVLVDGLAAGIDHFLSEFYNAFGTDLKLIGGGAGSLRLEQLPCIFNNRGMFQDAAVIALLNSNVEMGVKHGWERIEGPFIANKTENNRIIELNWKPAFDLYREAVARHTPGVITKDNFFELAKAFPFGMFKEGAEDIVRDPLKLENDGSIVCVGSIPKNSVINILHGNEESLTTAAKDCTVEAISRISGNSNIQTVVIDCVSRALFMEHNFSKELNTIEQGLAQNNIKSNTVGALTLGEIGSYGLGFPQFFNKTLVIGNFYD